jgi:hypothetical protein
MRIMARIAAGGQAGLATLFGSGIAHAEPGFKPSQCGPYPVGWLCDETDYLRKLARDGITVHDPAAERQEALVGA